MNKIAKKIRAFLFLSFLFLSKNSVFAQDSDWSLQLNWPDSPGGASLSATSKISELVNYVFEWGIVLGIILTFGVLIYASFSYVTSTGNYQKLSKAKNRLSSSFLGLLLLFSSWLLISILNPELSVISNVNVLSLEPDVEALKMDDRTEDQLCDYGIVSYSLESNGDLEKAIIQEGEVDFIKMNPYSSIVCKSNESFGDDYIEEGSEKKVKFIKVRSFYGHSNLEPLCDVDCADPDKTCPDEISIKLEEDGSSLPKYCYDLEQSFTGYGTTSKQYLYISQKPDSSETTCLAGDKKLPDGGGCSLNLYSTDLAGRCGEMITSTNPSGNDVDSSYDKPIECIEIIRHTSPVEEEVLNNY